MIPISVVTITGVQAANTSGIRPDKPSANTRSVIKYKKKPKNKPARIHFLEPVRVESRSENVAAIKTIAHRSSGEARRACQWSRCRTAEKPAFSRTLINWGRSQKDIVVGEAKLS